MILVVIVQSLATTTPNEMKEKHVVFHVEERKTRLIDNNKQIQEVKPQQKKNFPQSNHRHVR